ncbi:MAG: hypothetical protein ACXABY_26355 [Candidatus Thorarchaeota archaeon]|jgi:hypothetical protein
MAYFEASTAEYRNLLNACYRALEPLMVYGGPGIGKSAIPRQLFRDIAEDKGLLFCEWNDLTLDEKKACIDNPADYFVFFDQRTSQMDTTSLQGIPNMTKVDLLENIPYSWVVFATKKESQGVVFFDEINLAAPIVQSITYSAIQDRVISDRRLADGVFVFAAGNRANDKAHTFDMPGPLRDRFCELEVSHSHKEWIQWAARSNVNPHLIPFIGWKPGSLYTIETTKVGKGSTPRRVEKASKLLREIDILSDEAFAMLSICCGQPFAIEFQAYQKAHGELEWDKIFKNPKMVKDLPLDQRWAVNGGLFDKFKESVSSDKQVDKIFEIVTYMDPDFAVNAMRMFREVSLEALIKGLERPAGKKLSDRCAGLLLHSEA